jgi:hypothetical protein
MPATSTAPEHKYSGPIDPSVEADATKPKGKTMIVTGGANEEEKARFVCLLVQGCMSTLVISTKSVVGSLKKNRLVISSGMLLSARTL